MAATISASAPFRIGALSLRNRLVATAHGSGVVAGGLARPGDDDYWRRCAAGGAAMVIAGGTVVSPDSANRTGNITEAWRPEAVDGLRRRASAIAREGAVPVCQLVHLGRETLGAEIWEHPVAPSPVRSPREPVRARTMSESDIDRVIDDFVVSSRHAAEAGFRAVELHAAHGYLLGQFLSPAINRRPDVQNTAGRVRILHRLRSAIVEACPDLVVGVRVSVEDADEGDLGLDRVCEILPLLEPFDYLNVTIGVRTTYVRDMATAAPPLLPHIERLRGATSKPLLVSQAFRSRDDIESALHRGADLIGLARPLIADPELPRKLISGADSRIRPCVSCNEDCRSFTPVLLCTVNPTLAPPGQSARPATPLRFGTAPGTPARVAVVGAGPAGLEAALRLAGSHDVTLFESTDRIGGQLRIAAEAPHRTGWARLLRFYGENLDRVRLELNHRAGPDDLTGFGEVVIATGATEAATDHTMSATSLIGDHSTETIGNRVVIVDDGFGYWLTISAIETALARGAQHVTVLVPGPAFAATIPPESRVQLLRRLTGEPVDIVVQAALSHVSAAGSRYRLTYRNTLSGQTTGLTCDRVVTVGERIASDWQGLATALPQARVQVIGDAVVPRRVAHAVAEGYAAAQRIRA